MLDHGSIGRVAPYTFNLQARSEHDSEALMLTVFFTLTNFSRIQHLWRWLSMVHNTLAWG